MISLECDSILINPPYYFRIHKSILKITKDVTEETTNHGKLEVGTSLTDRVVFIIEQKIILVALY